MVLCTAAQANKYSTYSMWGRCFRNGATGEHDKVKRTLQQEETGSDINTQCTERWSVL